MEASMISRSAIRVFACILSGSILLFAQYTTASLGGSVSDQSGAVVPAARVTVTNVDTGFKQTAETDATGAFLFARLPVGPYELRVDKEGFPTYVQTGISLAVNQDATIRVTM